MFYIRNDDMEDMFKKAADNYELNEDMAADWNNVRATLQNDSAFTASVSKEKKHKRLHLLWWLLLIPAILIVTYKTGSYFSADKQKGKAAIAKQNNAAIKNNLQEKGNAKNNNNAFPSSPNVNSTNNTDLSSRKKISSGNKSASADKHSPSVINTKAFDIITGDANKDAANSSINTKAFDIRTGDANKDAVNSSANNNPVNKIKETSNNYHQLKTNGLTEPVLKNDKQKTSDSSVLKNSNTAAQTNSLKQKSKNNNYTRQAFAFAGIAGNIDLSMIKFQKLSRLGSGIGMAAGYHFKNGLSIESGLLYDKKNYYTKGEYFNKSNFGYLEGVNLITAQGNCHMWEIPLNLSYDFATHKRYNWFVTAGVSSYIMDREFYNFKYEKDGLVRERANDYYHSSPDWFSVLNVGGGINVQVNSKYFLQAQPYFKIPVSAVGKGNLSLSSGGINISFKRRLF